MPEKCEKCDHTRFRQSGDTYICKSCGHVHKATKVSPPSPKADDNKKS